MALLIPANYPEPVMVFQGPGDPPPVAPAVGRKVTPAAGEGKEFTLEEMQGYVGGMIEISSLGNGQHMVINEEGKLQKLPVNVEATIIYRAAWRGRSAWAAKDTIVGDVLICEPGEVS